MQARHDKFVDDPNEREKRLLELHAQNADTKLAVEIEGQRRALMKRRGITDIKKHRRSGWLGAKR